MVYLEDSQSYGVGWSLHLPLCCSGNGLLARVTPPFFWCYSAFVLFFTFTIWIPNGMVGYAARSMSPQVVSPVRHRVTRANGANPVVKDYGGTPPTQPWSDDQRHGDPAAVPPGCLLAHVYLARA